MGYVPRGARWWVAEIVERVKVARDRRSVVHVNFCLIEAKSPAEAYSRARTLGRAGEVRFKNPAGQLVSIKFLGLRDLHVLHDPLEHGAELLFEEHVGMSDAAVRALVRPRRLLSVFLPRRHSAGPDYSSADVLEDVARLAAAARK
jgi:hypothetical protein